MTPESLVELSHLPISDLSRIQAKSGALELPLDKSVAILRYDDVVSAFANPELTVRHRFRATLRLFGPTIFDTDGRDHRRQKIPVVRGLVDGKTELIDTSKIDQIAARAVANLRDWPVVELIGDLAVRIVTEVMAHLTGLSPEESLHLYGLYRPVEKAMSGDASTFKEARTNLLEALDVYTVQRHRQETKHSAPLTRALDSAVANGRLNTSELDSHQIILFLAGVESTVCAISNVLWMLVTDGKLLRRLRELGSDQLESAVAELLRFQPPLFSTVRFAVSSLDIRGIAVTAGTPVHLCLAPACRDPKKFPAPHRLDLTRPTSTNLMFGHGIHFCAGTAIAKEEVRATLDALISQVDIIRPLKEPSPIKGHCFRMPRALKASIDWVR